MKTTLYVHAVNAMKPPLQSASRKSIADKQKWGFFTNKKHMCTTRNSSHATWRSLTKIEVVKKETVTIKRSVTCARVFFFILITATYSFNQWHENVLATREDQNRERWVGTNETCVICSSCRKTKQAACPERHAMHHLKKHVRNTYAKYGSMDPCPTGPSPTWAKPNNACSSAILWSEATRLTLENARRQQFLSQCVIKRKWTGQVWPQKTF